MSQLNPVNKFFCLQSLCESNFSKLLRLIPHLRVLDKCSVAYLGSKPALHLKMIEKSTYTLTLELSYCFHSGHQPLFEPALKLRVYLDASMVEVMSDCERPRWRLRSLVGQEVLEHKWQMNYFLDKWLDHCLQRGYRFSTADGGLKAASVNV